MKQLILIFTLISTLQTNNAAADIRGIVVDEYRKALQHVTVSAVNDSTVVEAMLTDSIGHFSINAPQSVSSLKFSLYGYKPLSLPINEFNDGDTITLTSDVTTLDELVVKADPITYEADRFVLNVNIDPMAKGKDMAQVLQTAPGVWLDRRTLSVLGKTGTQVYINDRRIKMSGERLYNYLQSLPSSAVASVEIIPTAGAEYSASYSGGIIRIKLNQKRDDGYNGNVSLSSKGGPRKFAFIPAVNFSYHSGKLTLDLVSNFSTTPYAKSTSEEWSENFNTGRKIYTDNKSRTHSFNPDVLLSAIIDFDKNNTLGVEAEYTGSSSHDTNRSVSEVKLGSRIDKNTGYYSSRNRANTVDTRVNYTHRYGSKGSYIKFLAGAVHRESTNDENNELRTAHIDSLYYVDLDASVTAANGELRLQNNFTKDWKLTAGVKHTYNSIDNKAEHTYESPVGIVGSPTFDYDAAYHENITAVYATVPGKIGIVSLRAGLRGEFYKASGAGLDHSEIGLFPTASLSLPMLHNGKLNGSLTYSRKIQRPTFWQMSPLVRQFSDYTFTVGNIDLKSSISNSLSLTMIVARQYTVGLSWSMTSDLITQVFTTNKLFPDRLYLSYDNLGKQHEFNLYFSGRVSLGKKVMIGGNLLYFRQLQKLTMEQHFDSKNGIQATLYGFVTLPGQFSLTATGYYYSPRMIGNIKTYTLADVSLSVNKAFGKKWNLNLSADNLLHLKNGTYARDDNFYRDGYGRRFPEFTLRASYSFSSGKSFKKKSIEKTLDSSRMENY